MGRLITEPSARGFAWSNASKSGNLVRGSPLAGERALFQRHGGNVVLMRDNCCVEWEAPGREMVLNFGVWDEISLQAVERRKPSRG